MKFFAKLTALFVIFSLMTGVCFADVASIEDLKSAKVGVEKNSTSESLVADLLKDGSGSMVICKNVGELIESLKAKTIDAAVMDETPARFFIMNEEGLKLLPEALDTVYYGIAFKKGNSLRDDVNNALISIKEDGTLSNIIAKYINIEEPKPEEIDFNRDAKGGKLWVGCSAAFPPYEMRTEKGFAGIDIELCAAIAKKLDKELIIVDYRFDVLPEALETNRIDMICSSYMISDSRTDTMDFSDPYDADQTVILVLE